MSLSLDEPKCDTSEIVSEDDFFFASVYYYLL